jgi:hypothetical protein
MVAWFDRLTMRVYPVNPRVLSSACPEFIEG